MRAQYFLNALTLFQRLNTRPSVSEGSGSFPKLSNGSRRVGGYFKSLLTKGSWTNQRSNKPQVDETAGSIGLGVQSIEIAHQQGLLNRGSGCEGNFEFQSGAMASTMVGFPRPTIFDYFIFDYFNVGFSASTERARSQSGRGTLASVKSSVVFAHRFLDSSIQLHNRGFLR